MSLWRLAHAVRSISGRRVAAGLAFSVVSGCGGLVTEPMGDGGSAATGGAASSGGSAAGGLASGGALISASGGHPAAGGALSADFAAVGGSGAQTGDIEAQDARRETLRGYWEHDKPLPVDERPNAPAWDSPGFVSASSSEPLCVPFAHAPELKGIHADSRGVFVAIARTCVSGLDDDSSVCDATQGSAVYHYANATWSLLALPSYTVEPMVGSVDGPLFFGPDVAFDPASGANVLRHPFVSAQNEPRSRVVSAGSATYLGVWNTLGKDGTTTIARFEGGAWVPKAIAGSTWALVGTDRSGAVYLERDTEVVAGIPPALTNLNLNWFDGAEIRGNSRDDFWVAAPEHVMRSETTGDTAGAEVTLTAIGAGETRLFGFAGSTLGYVSYLGWTELASLAGDPQRYFEDLAVVSDTELYVTLRDREFDTYKCGGLVVLKWDGSTFTRI